MVQTQIKPALSRCSVDSDSTIRRQLHDSDALEDLRRRLQNEALLMVFCSLVLTANFIRVSMAVVEMISAMVQLGQAESQWQSQQAGWSPGSVPSPTRIMCVSHFQQCLVDHGRSQCCWPLTHSMLYHPGPLVLASAEDHVASRLHVPPSGEGLNIIPKDDTFSP